MFVSIFHQVRQLVELQNCGHPQIGQLMINIGPFHVSATRVLSLCCEISAPPPEPAGHILSSEVGRECL